MTFTEAKAICKSLGYVLARSYGDEYRVRPIGASPKNDLGYYTGDLDDAVDTCRAIADTMVSYTDDK